MPKWPSMSLERRWGMLAATDAIYLFWQIARHAVDRNVFGRPVARRGHLVLTDHTLKTTLSACWDSTVRCAVRSRRQDRLLRRLVRLPLGTLQGPVVLCSKGDGLHCCLPTWQRFSVSVFQFVFATPRRFAGGRPAADVSFGCLLGVLLLFVFRCLCLCLCPRRTAALVVVPHLLEYQMIPEKTSAVGAQACF